MYAVAASRTEGLTTLNAPHDDINSSRRDLPLRARQWIAAAIAMAAVAYLAYEKCWPFTADPTDVGRHDEPSVWDYLFADRYVLGAIRLAVFGVALYVVASVPALIVAGRWLKGFGASGLSADDREETNAAIEDLEVELAQRTSELELASTQIDRLTEERDTARRIAVELYDLQKKGSKGRRTPQNE